MRKLDKHVSISQDLDVKVKTSSKNIKGHILMNLILSYMNILMGKMNLQKFLFL